MRTLALLFACGALTACDSGGSAQPLGARMISSAGSLVRELDYADGTLPVFLYHSATVYGDMSVGDFTRVTALVGQEFEANEEIYAVYNYREFPPSAPRIGGGSADLSVWSCTEFNEESCSGGRAWDVADEGAFRIVGRAIWRN